jgi:hypothetical protein
MGHETTERVAKRTLSTATVLRDAVAIYVDVILLVTLLLLFSPRLTGLSIHEWIGISLGATMMVHLLLSWSWISGATRRLAARRSGRARMNYVLNWLLFVLVIIELTSGIAISQVSLPSMGIHTINDRSWRALHNLTLNWTLLLIGIHVAMNWRPLLMGAGRRLWLRRPSS